MEKQSILVLGGTEFMGRTLISELLKREEFRITMLNRGNQYWGSENPFGSSVQRILCDREDRQRFISFIKESVSNRRWDFVVDFSAFHAEDIEALLEGLNFGNSIGHYIYISSDSVYMVCQRPQHSGYRKEDDAIRPTDSNLSRKLCAEDAYGNGKLECEELLMKAFRENKFPCTCLRLPDVFGPFDTSDRHWKYQLWTKASSLFPVRLYRISTIKKLSFVYSNDVVSAILAVIYQQRKQQRGTNHCQCDCHSQRNSNCECCCGQAFNIAQVILYCDICDFTLELIYNIRVNVGWPTIEMSLLFDIRFFLDMIYFYLSRRKRLL